MRSLLGWLLLFGTTLGTEPTSSTASKQQAPIRFLALGDSFTAGTGSSIEQSFPTRLAERWRKQGREVVLKNLGVNGYTTDALIEDELPEVKAFAPTRVTLAIGANDLVRHRDAETYRAKLEQIFTDLKHEGVPAEHIWVLPQPDWARSPVAENFGEPEALEAEIVHFNSVLREECNHFGATFIDLWPLMQKQATARQIASDGLHPSADSYDAWAEELSKRSP